MINLVSGRLRETKIDGIRAVEIEDVPLLDLKKTFDCGQCFRFEPVEDSRHETEVAGVAQGRAVSFAMDGRRLYIYNATPREAEQIWIPYLGLDRDYAAIYADILSRSDNAALVEAVRLGQGIRILRQQPWEAVCSFIISQNNNIPRIKRIIGSLCEKYGQPLEARGMEAHGVAAAYGFPEPQAVVDAGVEGMLGLKTGFRAKYIVDGAAKFCDGTVAALEEDAISTAEAAELLKSIKGVGDKVAACSLLFGFARLDAFPVDVWIKKVIARYFGDDFTAASLGPYAGVAQQVLFYYERWLGGDR